MKALDSKSSVLPKSGTVGSNPTLSAIDIVLRVGAVKPDYVKYASGMFYGIRKDGLKVMA